MKAADYIVSYDIAHPRRLGRLSRRLEKVGLRIQYSVFFVPGLLQEELFSLIDAIEEIIDPDEDDVRIYTFLGSGIRIGTAMDLKSYSIFS